VHGQNVQPGEKKRKKKKVPCQKNEKGEETKKRRDIAPELAKKKRRGGSSPRGKGKKCSPVKGKKAESAGMFITFPLGTQKLGKKEKGILNGFRRNAEDPGKGSANRGRRKKGKRVRA